MFKYILTKIKPILPCKWWSFLSTAQGNGLLGLLLFGVFYMLIRAAWYAGAGVSFDDNAATSQVIWWGLNLTALWAWLSEITAQFTGYAAEYIFRMKTVVTGIHVSTDNAGVFIAYMCAGGREYTIMLFLLLLLPGPWRHKGWYIAASFICFFLLNSIRLAHLAYLTTVDMEAFDFWHNELSKLMSLMLFIIWLIWERNFALPYREKIIKSIS